MSEHDERVEALIGWLVEQGGSPGCSLHSWRCEHPDIYGECDCLAQAAHDLLASPVMRDLLAAERAKALREAADESRVEWAIHYPGEREPRIGPDEHSVRGWQTYWNTHRHPELAEAVVVSRVVTTTAWEADRIHPADPEETR